MLARCFQWLALYLTALLFLSLTAWRQVDQHSVQKLFFTPPGWCRGKGQPLQGQQELQRSPILHSGLHHGSTLHQMWAVFFFLCYTHTGSFFGNRFSETNFARKQIKELSLSPKEAAPTPIMLVFNHYYNYLLICFSTELHKGEFDEQLLELNS